jgi:hypothetical protein
MELVLDASLGIQLVRWVLLFTFGVFIYRRFKLPTFPWLGAFYGIRLAKSIIGPFVMKPIKLGQFTGADSLNIPALANVAQVLKFLQMTDVADLLVMLLVISEIIHLLLSLQITEVPAQFKWTLKFRENANFWGIILIILSLMNIISSFAIYDWFIKHSSS